jgi:hypothetical protein
MKAVNSRAGMSPASLTRLSEIQEDMRTMCEPHYDEYHKVSVERGFIKITIPKAPREKKTRRAESLLTAAG